MVLSRKWNVHTWFWFHWDLVAWYENIVLVPLIGLLLGLFSLIPGQIFQTHLTVIESICHYLYPRRASLQFFCTCLWRYTWFAMCCSKPTVSTCMALCARNPYILDHMKWWCLLMGSCLRLFTLVQSSVVFSWVYFEVYQWLSLCRLLRILDFEYF